LKFEPAMSADFLLVLLAAYGFGALVRDIRMLVEAIRSRAKE
jgi:hypothetical protein